MANITYLDLSVMVFSIIYFVSFLGWYLIARYCKFTIVYKEVNWISIGFCVYFLVRMIVDIIFYIQVLKDPKADENDDYWEKIVTIFSTIVSRLKYVPLYCLVAWAEGHRINNNKDNQKCFKTTKWLFGSYTVAGLLVAVCAGLSFSIYKGK
jgi:hypothetical protein